MLDIMRKKKNSIIIKIVFVVIVLSFIGTMFLVWGEGRSGMGGGSLGYAAKVDGSKITLEEYQNSYQRIRNVYQQIYGQSLPAEMEKMLGSEKGGPGHPDRQPADHEGSQGHGHQGHQG